MLESSAFFHYFATIFVTVIPALCAGLSQARSCTVAFQAIRIQPAAEQDISSIMIIGNALTETAAIIGVVFGYILTHANIANYADPYWGQLSELGILTAIGITGAVVSYVSSSPIEAACYAIARQPFFSKKIQFFIQ